MADFDDEDSRDAGEPYEPDIPDEEPPCSDCGEPANLGHTGDCMVGAMLSQNQHVEYLEQELEAAKKRIADLEAPALKVTLEPFCIGCGKEIDPETCGCGSSIDHYYDGHSPIPMGCSCLRNDLKDSDIARGLRERLGAVMERVRAAGVVIVEESSR